MIGVGVPKITTKQLRVDCQAVLGLDHMAAQPIKLGLERSQPIGLVAADVCDTSDVAGVIRKSRDCRDHRCQLSRAAQIKIDSMDVVGALYFKSAVLERHLSAEMLQDLTDH